MMTVLGLLTVFCAAAAGAVVGSFSTTAAMRAAAGVQWIVGGSCCDHCVRPLALWETIPIVSYALTRGRCGRCGAPISWLHTAGEASGALAFAAASLQTDLVTALVVASLGALLIAIAIFDRLTLRIPTGLTLAVALVGAVGAIHAGRFVEGAIAAVAAFALLALLQVAFARVRGHQGLGDGDVKLLAALAISLGAEATALTLAIAAGAALTVMRVVQRGVPAQLKIAFGPYIALGAWIMLLGGLH